MKKIEIEHEYTDEVTCPFCGYVFSDSWEYKEDDIGLIECPECEKEFYAERYVEVTYCTWEPTVSKCSVCGKEDVVVENFDSNIGNLKSVGVNCCMQKEKERLNKEYWEKAKGEPK